MRFNNIDRQNKAFYPELKQAFDRVLDSGWVILGNEVIEFQSEFAEYVGAEHCVGISSGMDALVIALKCLDIGEGDEVIVPANTYIATWLAVDAVGAKVVPVEPNVTYCINPDLITTAITNRTKAIIPVHLFGTVADMNVIEMLANQYDLKVIYDAAQAHGALYLGRKIGGRGDITAWSFYPTKNLGALGDAGAITTDNLEIAQKAIWLRNYGSPMKYLHAIKGINARLDELQAAFLRVKLKYLDKMNERRNAIAYLYNTFLHNTFEKPLIPFYSKSVYHQYVIRVDDRPTFFDYLTRRGIPAMCHYPIPPHLTGAFVHDGLGRYPITEKLGNTMVSLPIDPFLEDNEIDHVWRTINNYSCRG